MLLKRTFGAAALALAASTAAQAADLVDCETFRMATEKPSMELESLQTDGKRKSSDKGGLGSFEALNRTYAVAHGGITLEQAYNSLPEGEKMYGSRFDANTYCKAPRPQAKPAPAVRAELPAVLPLNLRAPTVGIEAGLRLVSGDGQSLKPHSSEFDYGGRYRAVLSRDFDGAELGMNFNLGFTAGKNIEGKPEKAMPRELRVEYTSSGAATPWGRGTKRQGAIGFHLRGHKDIPAGYDAEMGIGLSYSAVVGANPERQIPGGRVADLVPARGLTSKIVGSVEGRIRKLLPVDGAPGKNDDRWVAQLGIIEQFCFVAADRVSDVLVCPGLSAGASSATDLWVRGGVTAALGAQGAGSPDPNPGYGYVRLETGIKAFPKDESAGGSAADDWVETKDVTLSVGIAR